MISIKDYNDDDKIDKCLSQGCEYAFNLVLNKTSDLS
jgi:hypothetical protein